MNDKKASPQLWELIKSRVQATWFWRIFGVCAMKRLWTKFLVAVAIMAGYWGLSLGIDLLNPILPLEQLERTEGELIRVYRPLNSAHGSTITVQTDDGRKIKFRGSIYDGKKALQQAVGQRIAVWHQDYFRLWPPFYYNQFWEIRAVTGYVYKSYERPWIGMNKSKPATIRWFKRLVILTFASLIIVILACFRNASQVQLHK